MTEQEKLAHPLVTIPNVQLEDFERAVYKHNYEESGRLLVEALRRLKGGAEFIGYSVEPRIKTILYTRFCAAVFALLTDPGFALSQEGFDCVAAEHATLDLLFRASAFGCSDHMLALVAEGDPAKPESLRFNDPAALVKFLLTYSHRSGFAMDYEATFRRSPQITAALYFGMLAHQVVTATAAHETREKLLGHHSLFADVSLTDAMLPTVSDAYMYCSYGVRPDKHAIKTVIHGLFARLVIERGVPLPVSFVTRPERDRPVVLVALEWFTSLHAMYRCFAPAMRDLRRRFRLVAMCRAVEIDDTARQEFDEVLLLPESPTLSDMIAQVRSVDPDVIFYPSVGMALWWVALASVRLAPVQVMGLGHPASSMSPAMDYVIAEETAIEDDALFTERIIRIPDGATRFVQRQDAAMPDEADCLFRGTPGSPIRVAISAMTCKLNAPFLATLREIQQRSEHKIEWRFFPNAIGTTLFQLAREIRDWLPEAVIHERTHYNAYVQRLAECELALSPFPFGNTNGHIDALLLRVPYVCMEGREPHERFDAQISRRARLPEWMVVRSSEEYVESTLRALQKIGSGHLLSPLSRAQIEEEFFGGRPEFVGVWADAMSEAMARGARS